MSERMTKIEKAIKFLEYLKKDDVKNFKEKCCDYEIEDSEIKDIESQYDEIIELLRGESNV